jgi:hypothetical protein
VNDREQVLAERQRSVLVAHGVDAAEHDTSDAPQWARTRAIHIRALYDALIEVGFDGQQALLLTGRLFND